MYLKSIEIQGFKSFAHKTLLNFNNGVTGIVGPNGSGKSNISDAVRWVLGEQKVKQLRGSAMQDVIFAGTELRKAQGFAFVSITLDNSDKAIPVDYTEVTVSRKLFRSGESDYMINGQSVRLKDVQELFYDTGIGREGYSIIGQGQIDAIINGRPQERRGLFDEAAGIVKFKKRKAAAVKRLENERDNLVRISDILNELEKRLRPLERQAETAKKYFRLKDEQKILDLNIFIRQTENLLDDLKKSKENLLLVRASLEETEEEADKLKDNGSAISGQIADIDSLIDEKKNEQYKAELARKGLIGQIDVCTAQINSDRENINRLVSSLSVIEKNISDELKVANEYFRTAEELNKSLDVIDEGSEDDIDFTEVTILQSRLSALKKSLSSIGVEKYEPEAADSEESSEEQSDEDLSFTLPDWMKSIRNKKDDLAEIREKEAQTTEWLNKATDEYNSMTGEIKSLESQLNSLQTNYASMSAKLESIRNIAERYEGYGESIQSVMREKNRLGGIKGVVADILRTDKEYETAIETALGAGMKNIVTDTDISAKHAIEFLKKNRLGRATFLPLNSIRYKEKSELKDAASERGAIGTASDLVSADNEYSELIKYLLGSVLVVDNIDNALTIARKYRHNIRIVTLDGELLSVGGAISGGTFRNNSNLMGRKREITDLEQSLNGLRRQTAFIKDKINKQEQLALEKSAEINDLNDRLKEINDERNELSFGISSDMKLRFSELRQKVGFVGENIERVVSSVIKQREDYQTSLNSKAECETRINSTEAEITERKADIDNIEKGSSELAVLIEEKINEKNSLLGKQSDYSARKEELSSNILELQKDVLRLENQVEKEQQRLDDETEYIWNEYEMSLSAAEAFRNDELGSVSVIRSRLSEVKSDIKKLGPVNVQAVDEYKEVSERYEFMKQQYDDLAQSEASILSVIEELDEGMKKQFDQQFASIKEEFQKVFSTLFGGGEATLGLVYDEDSENGADELEAGISITVQPPGKKLQSIMQLSGGEKALTAIALLFAIQNLKPSPFCLLDEIEAALDDSNVTRFAGYLHNLTDHTQFIVITHRRGTMESADRLYGVTMQEKGISKLVSVDLVSDQLI